MIENKGILEEALMFHEFVFGILASWSYYVNIADTTLPSLCRKLSRLIT